MRSLRPLAALAGLALFAAACQDGSAPSEPRPSLSTRPEGFPTAGEERTGYVLGPDGTPTAVSYAVHGGRAIWEGDIDLGPAEKIAATPAEAERSLGIDPAAGVVRDAGRWPGGVVPYVISSTLPKSSRVTNAISHIESKTSGVTFVPRTTQRDYVQIVRSNGCASSVGMMGGVQTVYLADGCSTGNTIHELAHALGVYHEQTRCDRDTYVRILSENIIRGYENNFTVQCSGATDILSYDEGSIMHYGPFDFSKNGLPTIVSLRGLDRLMGQRSGLSSTDVSTINRMYP